MKTSKARVLVVVAVVVAATSSVFGVPKLLSYQGVLNDESGVPVNGAVSLTFSIYDGPAGGVPLWTENQTVQVSNGVFTVLLGSVEPLDVSALPIEELYLGIKVGADSEMTPRQRIISSAFAQRAETLSSPIVPIGAVVAWSKSMPGTPALPDGWVECNGQVLSDAESPYDGQTVPNLNGVSGTPRFLRGGASSGSTGGSESHTHTLQQRGVNGGATYSSAWGGATDAASTLPSYYTVVWIMRIK